MPEGIILDTGPSDIKNQRIENETNGWVFLDFQAKIPKKKIKNTIPIVCTSVIFCSEGQNIPRQRQSLPVKKSGRR